MRSLIFLIIVASVSCVAPDKRIDDNTLLARKLFDSFNRHDWKAMAGLYADSAMFLDPSFGKAYVRQTEEQIISKYADLQKVFPDIKDELGEVYGAGDKVTVEFISSGTMENGTTFKLPIVSILTFDHGRIIKDATYYDLENP